MFDQSLCQKLPYSPWRYTTQPTYDANGNMTDPGVTQTLDGVFIMLSRALVDMLKANLSAADQATLEGYVYNVTADQAGMWHVPVWAGDDHAVYIRVPATVWSDPTTDAPAKVKAYFQRLWQDAQS